MLHLPSKINYITTGHLNSQHQAEFELFSTEVELRNLKVIAIVFKLFIPREDTSKTVPPAQNTAMTESLSIVAPRQYNSLHAHAPQS